jgi:hypothetical protein
LIALGYPSDPSTSERDDYRAFIYALARVLPCDACRSHLEEHLRASPPDVALARGGRALLEWTVALHNTVNAMLGKSVRRDAAGVERDLRRPPAAAAAGNAETRERLVALAGVGVGLAVAAVLVAVMGPRRARCGRGFA